MILKKKIVRLAPSDDVLIETADRHYTTNHFRFAAITFQSIEAVRAYHSNRALGQYDLNGSFREHPTAWRFVVTQWDATHDGDHAVGWLDERVRDLFFADRRNGIGGVSSFELDERVVIDRRSGQLTAAKYIFEYASGLFPDAHTFSDYYNNQHLVVLADAAAQAAGLRLVLTNTVLREAETGIRADGHTAYTGGYLDAPSAYAFEEYWFDNEHFASAFFSSPQLLAVMRDSPWGRMTGYHVEEHCGIDRR